MNPGQKGNAKAPIDLKKKWTREIQGEVEIAFPDVFLCATPLPGSTFIVST